MDNTQYKYMVAVRCFTFQHANYIQDALDGFCMQQTTFPYICIVVDDASTDGEQDVINYYITEHFDVQNQDVAWQHDTEEGVYQYAQHKTNKNCYILSLNLKKNLNKIKGAKKKLIAHWDALCKYHALCEGDDYWINPKKLQQQVDYMECHPETVMVHTLIKVREEEKIITDPQGRGEERNVYTKFLQSNPVSTLTVLYRAEIIKKAVELKEQILGNMHLMMGDYPLWISFSLLGQIHTIQEITGIYRLTPNSASRPIDKKKRYLFDRNIIEIQEKFFKYCKTQHLLTKHDILEYKEKNFFGHRRLIRNHGLLAKKSILKIWGLFPYWPYIILQKCKRVFYK